MLGPTRSSNPPCPLCRILFALQWKVNRAYIIVAIATIVNKPAEIRPTESPKLRRPIASPPRMTVKFSHDKKVRSLAKKTLGSTRVGSAILLPKTGQFGRCCDSGHRSFPYQARSEGGVDSTCLPNSFLTTASRKSFGRGEMSILNAPGVMGLILIAVRNGRICVVVGKTSGALQAFAVGPASPRACHSDTVLSE
jgi:hypothetical protein